MFYYVALLNKEEKIIGLYVDDQSDLTRDVKIAAKWVRYGQALDVAEEIYARWPHAPGDIFDVVTDRESLEFTEDFMDSQDSASSKEYSAICECGHKFNWSIEPEICMGSVTCPKCKKPVGQDKIQEDSQSPSETEFKVGDKILASWVKDPIDTKRVGFNVVRVGVDNVKFIVGEHGYNEYRFELGANGYWHQQDNGESISFHLKPTKESQRLAGKVHKKFQRKCLESALARKTLK